jgi:hypothetical protein
VSPYTVEAYPPMVTKIFPATRLDGTRRMRVRRIGTAASLGWCADRAPFLQSHSSVIPELRRIALIGITLRASGAFVCHLDAAVCAPFAFGTFN